MSIQDLSQSDETSQRLTKPFLKKDVMVSGMGEIDERQTKNII